MMHMSHILRSRACCHLLPACYSCTRDEKVGTTISEGRKQGISCQTNLVLSKQYKMQQVLVLSASICCTTMHVGRGLWRVSGNSLRAMCEGSSQSLHAKHLVVCWCLDGMSPAFPWTSTTPSNLIRHVTFHCPPAIMCIHVQKPYNLQYLSCKGGLAILPTYSLRTA